MKMLCVGGPLHGVVREFAPVHKDEESGVCYMTLMRMVGFCAFRLAFASPSDLVGKHTSQESAIWCALGKFLEQPNGVHFEQNECPHCQAPASARREKPCRGCENGTCTNPEHEGYQT